MAAINPATLYRESSGSLTMLIANFAIGASPGDTWDTNNTNIVAAWAAGQTGSQTGTCVSCNFSGDTLTFGGGVSVTMPAFQCIVLARC